MTSQWEFTLPITPQQLSVTDQFAINTTATMRGVVEEHNGVKFKIISASGTTGILPSRSAEEDPDSESGQGLSLFGGTLEAIGSAVDATQKLASQLNNLTGGGGGPKNTELSIFQESKTGYYQSLLLQQFLEQYAMAKKDPANKHWRLVFHCPKTNESFVVTPMQFTATKSQRSPGEVLFNMQFKAWKRIDLKAGVGSKTFDIQALDPNFFQSLSEALDNASRIMSAYANVIRAVRADFRKPFEIMRKLTLLIKNTIGLAIAVSELPNQIKRDIQSSMKKQASDLSFISNLLDDTVKDICNQIKAKYDTNEGLSADDVEAGVNGEGARDSGRVDPIRNVFDNPEFNWPFFNAMSIQQLKLNTKQKDAIQDEIIRNSLISIEEIKGFIRELQSLTYDLGNNFGAGDPFLAEITGQPVPRERATPMTTEEFELLVSLENVVMMTNQLVATRDFDDDRTQSPLQYVGGLAQDADIPFNSDYTAKYLAPVPFGLTIQEIAARYMGDPDLFNEIVTLNNLRSPYIDEDGFFYSLLSNGDGRQFNINSNLNLFVGQKIQLSSSTVPLFTRKITAIEKITDTNYLITVDGISNLDTLKTSEQAKTKAFLPGTINSQNQIYIPTDQVVENTSRTFDIPFLEGDTLTGLSKVDWLMDDSGDIVINSFGEVSLANGLTNLVQALKMKVATAKGGILSNPDFGLGLQPGVTTNDLNVGDILADLREMVLQDARFEAVDKIEINLLPPDLSITIKARLANGRGIFPITFTV